MSNRAMLKYSPGFTNTDEKGSTVYLTQSLHRALQQDPDRALTICEGRSRTVAESIDRVARLAAALCSVGVERGDRVGILALNSDRYHEYLLAVPWMGGAVNPANIRWSPTEIAYSLVDCDTRVLLVDDAFVAMVPELRALAPNLSTVIFCGDGPAPEGMLAYEALVAGCDPIEDVRSGDADLYGVFYTGGTTGHPKGVMLTHDNLLTSAIGSLSTGKFVTPGGTLMHAAPMFHIAGIGGWTAGMLVGSTHVIVPRFVAADVLAAISGRGVTDAVLVPTMIQMLLDDPALREHDLSGVRSLIYGASPISETVLERARRSFPRAGFTQAYGMTELSPVATLLLPADHDDPKLRRAAGRAAPHVEVRIVDPEDREVPVGTVGEVAVRGDNAMKGYWNRPEETAEALRGGWMHTGDGGYIDERGYLFIVDRIKDMIVTGGENVYSAEVENALSRHDAVASCAVIGVPDPDWGERVHAVVVLKPGMIANDDDLRDVCRTQIANYKLPRSIEYVTALPVSGAGKILKRELRAPHWGDRERNVG